MCFVASIDNSANFLRVLVGNKCDKESEIPERIGAQFATNQQFDLFMETSALHLANVNKLFETIAEVLVERKLASLSGPTVDSHQSAEDNNPRPSLSIIGVANEKLAATKEWYHRFCCST